MFPPFNLLLTSPKWLLHLKGLAVFAAAVAGCRELGDSWVKFALLFFVPDIFMAGYFFGTKMGAAVYNLGHTCASPILLSLAAYFLSFPPAYPVSLIWIAPIGFDRLLGYGLSTPRHLRPPIWEKSMTRKPRPVWQVLRQKKTLACKLSPVWNCGIAPS